MINRRAFLGFVGAIGIVMPARRGHAQQHKPFRIGSLTLSAQPKFFTDRWLAAMRELGYMEGENVFFELRDGSPTQLQALTLELIGVKVDLMLCVSSAPVRAAMAVIDQPTRGAVATQPSSPVTSALDDGAASVGCRGS